MKKPILVIMMFTMLIAVSFALTGCGEDQVVLNVYNWGDYIDESILNDFEDEYGIKVNYEMYATNEDMYLKLKQGGTSYDVIFPSDYMIEKMIKEDMLATIDPSQLTNYDYIDDTFKNLEFDPENQYSVPYFWGTVGIFYNTDLVDETVDSWDILWDDKYAGEILMYDSQRDSIAVALKKLGYSLNSKDVNELEEAKQLLIEQKPLVLAYVGDNVKDMMVNGEAALSVVWSGEASAIMLEHDNFDYVVPKEGSNIWFDGMAIPKNSENYEEAMLFIDFMSRPDIAYRNADYVGYSTPISEAYELLDDEMKNLPTTYPDLETLPELEIFKDPGDFIGEYNRIWTEVKAN